MIGSSVAVALRRAGWWVTGSDLDTRRAQRAVELGVVDALGRDDGASLAVLATPVGTIVPLARARLARPGGTIVTDVGSVKREIVANIDDARFVGGHPMAGSEQEGPDGADANLFAGATWVLTPTARTDEAAYATVRGVVAELGAEVVALPPERHDEIVAVVSHVPHLSAATLMALAADAAIEHGALLRLAAGGFRDMTRIAAGDSAIWPDIFDNNRGAVLATLDAFIDRLRAARRMVAEGDRDALVALLERARRARRNLPAHSTVPETLAECRVPVPDRPGVLAEVTTLLGELGVNIVDLEIAHSTEGDAGVLVVSIDATEVDKVRVALTERGYRPGISQLP